MLPVEVEERPLPGEPPQNTAWRLALAKAEAVARVAGEGTIVGADTVVAHEGETLGKPRSPEEAFAMLRRLRGREHEVVSGVAILNLAARRGYVSSVCTRVWMRDYADEEIAAYVASGEPFDKAGAYAIQSTELRPVARVEGCYLNVVGLPLCEVVKGLQVVGFPLPPAPVLDAACAECAGHLSGA